MLSLRCKATLCAGVIAFLSGLCGAHGGQYRGPGDVVPPGPVGGGGGSGPGDPTGPTTPGPTGPTSPRPTGPTGGGTTGGSQPPGPGAASGGRTPARGADLLDDLTTWTYWWEFNKDRYLRLKDAVHAGGVVTGDEEFFVGKRRAGRATLRPTSTEILGEILPALKKAIDATDNRDVASSCMVAMAKVGADHPEFKLADVFESRLHRPDQEVRETAALSLGIAAIAGEREVGLLLGLALDDEQGRAAVGGAVDARTRSFAAYGLGLLAHRHESVELKRTVFDAMQRLLGDESIANRNIKVAAIHAISILDVGRGKRDGDALLADAVACLEAYYVKPLGPGEQLIQAHCPTALAKLIGRDHARRDHFKALFAADLQGKGKIKRSGHDITRSCAMALGQIVRAADGAEETKSTDAQCCRLLLDTYHDHKDAQTRWFAILALGQIGGARNRETILRAFDAANRNQQRPWCALALGVLEFERQQHAHDAAPDALITTTLLDAFTTSKDPSLVGSLSIALGLCRAKDTAPILRERLLENLAKEEMAGYLCIGLALMDDSGSREDIRSVMLQSLRRPVLLPQAAVALGKLGDKRAAEDLQSLLRTQTNLATLSAIAAAVGSIGDRHSIGSLKAMLFEPDLRDMARAFAAVALGGVGDKEPAPWNSKIGANTNYRAAVETLTNQQSGILDIL